MAMKAREIGRGGTKTEERAEKSRLMRGVKYKYKKWADSNHLFDHGPAA